MESSALRRTTISAQRLRWNHGQSRPRAQCAGEGRHDDAILPVMQRMRRGQRPVPGRVGLRRASRRYGPMAWLMGLSESFTTDPGAAVPENSGWLVWTTCSGP